MSLKNAPHLSEISIGSDSMTLGMEGGASDPYLPSMLPRKKWNYDCKWDMTISGQTKEFNLGKQPALKGLFNTIRGSVSLNHPEIHVVWRGLVPATVCKNDVIVTCRFTPDLSERMGLMSQNQHGIHLYMHHIFYPGHSINVGVGQDLPWAVGFSVPDLEVDDKYVIAQVHVRVTGYFSQIPEYSSHRNAELISIVPMEETVTGFTMSAPRVPNQEWIIGGYKMGIQGRSTANKIKFLQEIGVDIEALKMAGELQKTIKLVTSKAVDINSTKEDKVDEARKVNNYLKQIGA